jgi:glycine cleavage system H protein
MPEFLQATVDKFIFRVATDRLYSHEGIWIQAEGRRVRIGVSDYLQQRSGDVAFADLMPVGTVLARGDELATIETIKVNISLTSPLSGTVIEINPAVQSAPEVINQDPYGAGWLAILDVADWQADSEQLLDAQTYFDRMKGQAEEELKNP